MGMLLWLAAIGHTLVMVARACLPARVAAVAPIAAAGLVTDFGRGWFWKSFRWLPRRRTHPAPDGARARRGVQRITTEVAVGGEDNVLK